ncbi:MAG TPA: hypothetical protein VES91_10530, partial [Burkholderiaceae bacterium]|nr:hypothetical protein [Burkholderiaceae bacterium]
MQRDALFVLLNRSPDAVWVVTPNLRLARELAREYDASQLGQGLDRWTTPRVVPFSTLIAELFDSIVHAPPAGSARFPLSSAQERVLWQRAVDEADHALLAPAAGAQLASDAWRLSYEWRIHRRLHAYPTGVDGQAFMQWARAYEASTEALGATDLARLPDRIEPSLQQGQGKLPERLILAGFAEPNPQQRGVFDALAARGVLIESLAAPVTVTTPVRVVAFDAHDEIVRIADWVSARLRTHPQARIGVVAPNLAAHKSALARALDAVLTPDRLLMPSDAGVRPYNISLGDPLALQPIVAAQLRLLRLSAGEIPF